jgi:alkylated DNA repair dioxygenase AlkB
MTQPELFATPSEMPVGFVYRANFVSAAEEERLVAAVQQLAFEEIRMHGVVAKRRTVQFGHRYGFENFKLSEAPSIPDFLLPLRERVSAFAGCAPERLEEVLVTEYPAGAQIGWHRDAPPFNVIVGVSLLGECTMKFRPWPVVSMTSRAEKRIKPPSQVLAPRSIYSLQDGARTAWQHHIPATKTLRYSITFRTLRQKP